MTFWEAIRIGYRRCLTFRGRASRSEFWYFVLYVVLGFVVCDRIDQALFGAWGCASVTMLFLVVGGLPLIPAAWRRMHDTGRSGFHVLCPAIVMIGAHTFVRFLGSVARSGTGGVFGALREAVNGNAALIVGTVTLVVMFTPLLVIWWLARPSEPRENRWGPPSGGLRPGGSGRG